MKTDLIAGIKKMIANIIIKAVLPHTELVFV